MTTDPAPGPEPVPDGLCEALADRLPADRRRALAALRDGLATGIPAALTDQEQQP